MKIWNQVICATAAFACAFFVTHTAQAAPLVSGSLVDASVSSPTQIGLDSSNSPTATLTVDDPASTAELFLNGKGPIVEVASDLVISITSDRIFFRGNDGSGSGEAGETLTFSGLQFTGGEVLTDIILTDLSITSLPFSLPTLLPGSLLGDGFTLNLDPISTAPDFGENFEITFVTAPVAVPLPTTLPLFLGGLGGLYLLRRKVK